jgi:hypothetical protein
LVDLSDNQLTALPPEITRLTNLARLDLRGNQLTIPPEILANPNNVKEIFAAITGLWGGQRLNEAKMLVVGDGKVGKSSVVERLIKGTFNAKKESTLGVEINDEIEVSQWEVESEGVPILRGKAESADLLEGIEEKKRPGGKTRKASQPKQPKSRR